MMIFAAALIIIGMILIYWKSSYSPHKAAFIKQMENRVKDTESTTEVCTAKEITTLPKPLQRYCKFIGLEGFPKHQAARIIFSNTRFVFNDKSGTVLDMDYDLWLFYDKPFRSAFCQSSMFGVPFEGMDYCTDNGEGGMKGMLAKAIPIFDIHNEQMYQAGLISWFAESLIINPSVLLSENVKYEEIDENRVKVTVSYNGVVGTGIITVNEEGAVTQFYSDERQVEEINGVATRIGWRCECEDYRMENGILQAHTVRSIKVFPDKEVNYFDSDNFVIEYKK